MSEKKIRNRIKKLQTKKLFYSDLNKFIEYLKRKQNEYKDKDNVMINVEYQKGDVSFELIYNDLETDEECKQRVRRKEIDEQMHNLKKECEEMYE